MGSEPFLIRDLSPEEGEILCLQCYDSGKQIDYICTDLESGVKTLYWRRCLCGSLVDEKVFPHAVFVGS